MPKNPVGGVFPWLVVVTRWWVIMCSTKDYCRGLPKAAPHRQVPPHVVLHICCGDPLGSTQCLSVQGKTGGCVKILVHTQNTAYACMLTAHSVCVSGKQRLLAGTVWGEGEKKKTKNSSPLDNRQTLTCTFSGEFKNTQLVAPFRSTGLANLRRDSPCFRESSTARAVAAPS